MKKVTLMVLILCIVMFIFLPVEADEQRENPSLYSFAEIVQKLPKMWMANPLEVMEMMKQYPDFKLPNDQNYYFKNTKFSVYRLPILPEYLHTFSSLV